MKWTTQHPRAAAAAGLAAMALIITACGGDSGPDPETVNADTPDEPDEAVDDEPDEAVDASDEAVDDASEPPVEPAEITVALGFLPNVEYAGNYVADHRGYFAAEELDVTLLGGGPNAPAPPVSVVSGEAQIGYDSNFERLLGAIVDGQDLVILGVQTQTSPAGLLSLADRPVTSADDLVGARIIAADRARPVIDGLMAVNEVSDWEFVPAGASVEALLAGEGDALLAFATNQPITLELEFELESGDDFFFASMDDLNRPTYANYIFVERSFLEEQRDVVVRYLRATAAGWQANAEDPELGTRLAVEEYGAELGLDQEQQQRANLANIPLLESDLTREHGLFWIDMDLFTGPILDAQRAAGMTDIPDPSSFVDLSVLEEVFAEGVEISY